MASNHRDKRSIVTSSGHPLRSARRTIHKEGGEPASPLVPRTTIFTVRNASHSGIRHRCSIRETPGCADHARFVGEWRKPPNVCHQSRKCPLRLHRAWALSGSIYRNGWARRPPTPSGSISAAVTSVCKRIGTNSVAEGRSDAHTAPLESNHCSETDNALILTRLWRAATFCPVPHSVDSRRKAMASAALLEKARQEAWSDQQVVSRVLAAETALYELLMRRYNQRLYRVARAILHDDAEAEDVMQDAYVRAYQHLADFKGRAKILHMADSNCGSRSPGPLSPSFAVSVARKFGETRLGAL